MHFFVRHSQSSFHHLVGLADHLHVAVLDAVVDHFDEMTGTAVADPVAARFAGVGLGRDRLEDRFDMLASRRVATGHDARAFKCAFFTSGNTGADVENSLFSQLGRSSGGIGKLTVATIDHDIAWIEKRQQGLDDFVDGSTGFDHDHDAAGAVQLRAEFLRRIAFRQLFFQQPGRQGNHRLSRWCDCRRRRCSRGWPCSRQGSHPSRPSRSIQCLRRTMVSPLNFEGFSKLGV